MADIFKEAYDRLMTVMLEPPLIKPVKKPPVELPPVPRRNRTVPPL